MRRRKRSLKDLDQDIRDHIEQDTQDNIERGMSPEDARAAALRKFGNVTLIKEDTRAVWIPFWIDQLLQDIRHGFRMLRRNPGFAAVVILVLALGIGANTAIFSVVNSLLLRTLPVVEPQRLVTVSIATATDRGPFLWTYAIWNEIRQQARTFDGAFAWSTERFNLAQGGEIQPVDGLYVSGDFFTALRVPALLGRTLTSADDVRGGGPAGPVAVISYGLWQRRFGGVANVIGTPIVVERVPFTIIGVTPPSFFGAEVGRRFDVALPLGAEPLVRDKDSRLDSLGYFLTVMLRLKPEQSLDAATATLRGLQPQIREATVPKNSGKYVLDRYLKDPFTLVPSATGNSSLRRRYERPLLTIMVVVALVLLIACVNIANLLLARATARRHELSVRLALGAPRWRLAGQLLVESVLLAGIGALVGLVIAVWGSRTLVAQLWTSVTRVFLDLSPDWRVLAFTVAITIATAVLFGTVPAFRATRVAPIDALKEHGRLGGRASVSNGLVMVLLVNLEAPRAPLDVEYRLRFYQRLVDAVAAVPGVEHAASSIITPVSGGGMNLPVDGSGTPPAFEQRRQPQNRAEMVRDRPVLLNFITPGWLATYGTTIRTGRDIDARDTANAPPIVLVNDAFVRQFFPGRDALGATVAYAAFLNFGARPKTVVGVVSDAVYLSLRDEVQPTMYVPLAQWDIPRRMNDVRLSVRSLAGRPESLTPSVAAALTAIEWRCCSRGSGSTVSRRTPLSGVEARSVFVQRSARSVLM